jgi:hypothetical protein
MGFVLVVIVRGWSGLDQIPSDPGYDYIQDRVQNGIRTIEVQPYLYIDQSLLASIASLVPLSAQGIVLALATHVIWAVCSLVVFCVLKRHAFGTVFSFIGGLLLVTTPWAAQSVIGNYGNVRWPIFVAATVIISAEVAHRHSRVLLTLAAAVAATFSNPLHPLLLVPLIIGMGLTPSKQRRGLAVTAIPLTFGFVFNLVIAGTNGHSAKLKSFWDDAGLFWVSGQILPLATALTGLILLAMTLRYADERSWFAINLYIMAVLVVATSYQLGGIADRYFVAPAALAAIGTLVMLHGKLRPSTKVTKILTVVIVILLAVPTVRWFFVFPYLRSAPSWSRQVNLAQERCATFQIHSFKLLTSDGESNTDPISCNE